jgi:hypothetical protein
MNHRPLRGAMASSIALLLAFAGGAAADTLRADGDIVAPPTVLLGAMGPGEVRAVDIGFILTCSSSSHVDPGQTVTVGIDSAVAQLDGAVLSVTDGTVGPVEDWLAEGALCPTPAPTYAKGTPSVVTLRAPSTPGLGYRYSLMYHRSISPFGSNDPTAIRGAIAVDILFDVNTAPVLTDPTVAALGTVEGDTTGGWTADWAGLGASDTEDDPDPTAGCSPAAGTVLSLGTTSVTCSVADTGGLTDTTTFDLEVVDTTAPTLTNVPADQHLTTDDPSGTTLQYTTPGATDVVDDAPSVGCTPASDSHLGLGTTTVTCTATDSSDNAAQASFDVTVDFVPSHVADAVWGEPVAGDGSTFTANRGRNVPIKVELFVDGSAATSGDASLTVTPCTGGTAVTVSLTFGSGRWNAHLDTTNLAGSCHTVTAWIDGLDAGSFQLELTGAEPVKAKARGRG